MSEVDEASDIAAVEAVTAEEMSSILEGDVAANVALLTDDAVIMPPNSPPAYGVQAAEEFFNDFVGTTRSARASTSATTAGQHGEPVGTFQGSSGIWYKYIHLDIFIP